MPRVSQQPAPVKQSRQQFPERLRVVRSAHVEPRGIHLQSAAFVTDGREAWRPGMSHADARPVDALDALRRNAEEAARRGVYAPERGADRRAA